MPRIDADAVAPGPSVDLPARGAGEQLFAQRCAIFMGNIDRHTVLFDHVEFFRHGSEGKLTATDSVAQELDHHFLI